MYNTDLRQNGAEAVYLQYYGFKDYPFSMTPDTGFLFLGTPHREALGHLLYGAGAHGGFVQLTGEVGTGKTTLIRALLDNRLPELDVALCWHPQLDVREFVATICDELGVSYAKDSDLTLKALVDRLNTHLLKSHAAGRRTLLIIDEAQNLSRDVLEQLRLLTNLETSKHKLLRIILVGQPELNTFLARHDLRQLNQRISARFALTSLDRRETSAYIDHRLACAGGAGRLFTPAARQLVYAYTRGTPRLINLVCERALMGGYARGRSTIDSLNVHQAARETLPRRQGARALRGLLWPGMAAAMVLLALALSLSSLPPLDHALSWVAGSDSGIVSETHAAALEADSPAPAADAAAAATAEPATRDAGSDAALAAGADPMPDINAQPLLLHGFRAASKAGSGRQPVRVAAAAPAAETGGGKDDKAAGNDDQQPRSDTAGASANVAAAPGAAKVGGHNGGDANATHAAGEAKAVGSPGRVTPLPEGDAQFSQLLRLWGVFGAEIETSCAALHVGELRCLSDQGTLATLERFNRPAILVLAHNGQRQRVLISELDKNGATLTGAKDARHIARQRLARLWTGQFFMIWRAHSGVVYIHDSMIGSAVAWLRTRLRRAAGEDPHTQVGPASPIFDDRLGVRLRHFQLMHGLKPDGVAGPRTQIMLNGVDPKAGTPTLEPEAPEKG